ncbi:MAG: MFS transporter [Pseudomonadota bacterium]
MTPLPHRVKAGYGIGQLAEGVKNGTFSVFLFFFYTSVLGLRPELASTALFIALVFDAVTDPLAGFLSDNLRSRFGRRHPFMVAAALPLAISFYLLFTPPELPQLALFVWLTVFTVLTRGAMTLYHVPHLSLGAELSEDFHERTTVVAYRYFSSYFGVLLSLALGFGVFFVATPDHPDGKFNVAAYGPFALTLGAIMVVTILISAVSTRSRIPYLPGPAEQQRTQRWYRVPVQLFAEMREALANRSFVWLFSGVLVIFTMVGVDATLNLHMNTYFWELKREENLVYFIAAPIGVLIGTTFARKLNELFDKKACIILGTTGWATFQILPVALRLLDWFPENQTTELVITLTAFKFIQGLVVAQSLVSFNSMIPDVVDEHELLTGKRQEGIFFSAISFSAKATTGLGTLVAGFALWLISWPGGEGAVTAADVTAADVRSLGIVFGPVVSAFAVLCIWCLTKLRLDRARHQEIVTQLKAQRAALPAAG